MEKSIVYFRCLTSNYNRRILFPPAIIAMVGTYLAACKIFFHRDGYTTHNAFAMLYAGHTLSNAAGVKGVLRGNVKGDGNRATDTNMTAVGSDLIILHGLHGEYLLFFCDYIVA